MWHLFIRRCERSYMVPTQCKEASTHFQSNVPRWFHQMENFFKSQLHDFWTFSETEEELINHLETYFNKCKEYNLMLSAKKCLFFANKITWCARIIDEECYQMYRQNCEAIRCMEFSITADELTQLVHCCRCMFACTPTIHKRLELQNKILEAVYKLARKWKRASKRKSRCGRSLRRYT